VPVTEMVRLKRFEPRSGYAFESFIQTGQRTVISYLTKPLHDEMMKAWREK
jgi:HlyD family secretion protein